MEIVLYVIILAVTVVFLAVSFYMVPRNFIKKNLTTIVIYIILTIIIYFFVINLKYFRNIFYDSDFLYIDTLILLTLSCSISLLLMLPFIFLFQTIKQETIIKNLEKKVIVDEFINYKDLVGNIPPALLMAIYHRRIKTEDRIVASYIYLKNHNVIKIDSELIVGDYNKELESHENYLISYFLGMVDQDTYNRNYKYYINDDLLTNKRIKALVGDNYNYSHYIELLVSWIIITQLVLMSSLFAINNVGIYMILAYLCPFLIIPVYKLLKHIAPVTKTNKGLETEAKLNNLKSYLINNRAELLKNSKIYEDYILYAILFNLKNTLNKDCQKEYNNIIKYINNSTVQLTYKKISISLTKEKIIGFIITFFIVTYMAWIFSTISIAIAIISWLVFMAIIITGILFADYNNN